MDKYNLFTELIDTIPIGHRIGLKTDTTFIGDLLFEEYIEPIIVVKKEKKKKKYDISNAELYIYHIDETKEFIHDIKKIVDDDQFKFVKKVVEDDHFSFNTFSNNNTLSKQVDNTPKKEENNNNYDIKKDSYDIKKKLNIKKKEINTKNVDDNLSDMDIINDIINKIIEKIEIKQIVEKYR
tara:strand:- start:23 stop:565 length:543 start_codon:yes stop_codon:yes gene_type:complete